VNPFTVKNIKSLIVLTAVLVAVMLMITPTLAIYADNIQTSAPRIKIREGTSTNWSGYASVSNINKPANNFVTDVKGSWTVPTLTCGSSATYSAIWVGIDGYTSNTVEQLGTEQDCSGGTQQNYVWYEMYPKNSYNVSNFPIYPGDVMTAEVKYTGSGKFQLSITDTTHPNSFSQPFTSKSAKISSAEWVMEAPWWGGVLPLANFGTVTFTNAQYKDSAGNAFAIDGKGAGTYDAITMNDPSGGHSTPSGLTNAGPSSSFSMSYTP